MFGVGGDSGSSMIRTLSSVHPVVVQVVVDVQLWYRISFSVLSAYVVTITHILF